MYLKQFMAAGAALLFVASCGKNDTDNSSSAPAAAVGAPSPLSSDFRLVDAQPVDVDGVLELLSPQARPTYERAEFDDALGAMVISNLRFADDDDGESVLIERAELFGVDIDAVERVRSASAATVDSPFETIFQKVRLFNVSADGFDEEQGSFSIGGVEFDNLRVRHGGIDGDGVGNDAARFFNGVNLGGIYLTDFSFSADTGDAPKVILSAPDLRFVDMSGGRLGAVIAKNLEYEMTQTDQSAAAMAEAMGPQAAIFLNGPLKGFIAPDNQRTTLEQFEWRGIDLSGLMAWGLKGEAPPATERDLVDMGTIKATGAETFIGERRAALIEEATMSAAEFTWLIPSRIRADTSGAFYDFTAYVPETEDEVLGILRENGLDDLKGDGYVEWTWDADSGVADMAYAAATEGLADIEAAVGLSNIKLSDIAEAQSSGQASNVVAGVEFRSLRINIVDEMALDTMFALSALQMGGSGEDLRQSAPALIRLSGAQAAQLNPRISDYVDAVAEFVANGGALEINASPEEPISLFALQSGAASPQALPDILNLTVTHKE